MNMHFQLNLTSGDHVVAAKLRIYKLPQENITATANGGFDEDEDDEKKIRISIYYYTKSLKKHRCESLIDAIRSARTGRIYRDPRISRSKETADGLHRDAPDGRGRSSSAGCQARPEILAAGLAESTWQR